MADSAGLETAQCSKLFILGQLAFGVDLAIKILKIIEGLMKIGKIVVLRIGVARIRFGAGSP